ncbi:MAG: choice-of-anchor J domain-containing protein, partial [Candidatus Marinimicrobia bacterium]|nr:choice-of-anchor J domain-containing protein [Candidatus Neomarinimicrobiota bacterium]
MRNYFNVWIIFLLPTSIAFSNVTVSIGDVAVTAYTEDIVVPVTVTNPDNTVGGFQFDVLAVPTIVTLSGAIPVDADNFSADYNVFDDGSGRIVFYSNTGNGIAAGGDGVVMNLHYDGSEVLSALVGLEAYDLTVSDEDGTVISGDLVNGSITIGNVVILSATSDTGDVSEEVYLDINLQNPSLVGGVQFDLYDTPNYLDVTGFSTTERSEGFTIDFNELENGLTRVLIYSADNENIESGTGPIVNMEMIVHDNAYNSNVGVNFENVTVTDDIGGTYWVAGADSGTVTVSPGYIEEPHNLQAQDGMDAQVLLNWEPPYGPIPEDFEEDFEEGVVPDDWTLTTNSAQGWFITQDGTSAFWTVPSHTWYMCSNDDMANDDGSMDYMIAPPLNVSGAQTITLNFASYYDGAFSHTAHIEVSTDGTNFTEVAVLGPTFEWVTETVDLSDHAGVPNLYIAFHSNDNGVWGSGWAVDDVFVTFAARNVERVVHYELTELGEWAVSAPKEDVISEFGGGIPYELRVDLDNPIMAENRPVDIDAYKVYRSLNSVSDFEEIAEVGGDVTTYLDEDVVNSTTYYYQVTAIYPDGSESAPTNTVSATPVEWVELWMDDGASLSGQMDTLDFYINNESDLGLFYFEIMDYPDVLHSLNILSTERTSTWALEIADQGDGTIAITGISIGTALGPGDGAVCRAVLYPVAEEEMTVNLSYTTGTSIQDVGYVDLNWTAEGGTYDVGIETQYATLTGGHGLAGETFTSSFILANTQPVYGIQLDIVADPPFMTGSEVTASDLIDFDGWEVSGNVVGTTYQLLMFDNTFTNPIDPGIAHIADIMYDIAGGVPEGTDVSLYIDQAIISDINNLPMHTEGIDANVYVGTPPVAFSIQNVTGELVPGGTGSLEVHLENSVDVNILEFYLADLPDDMTITAATQLDRFDDGVIDGSSEELEDGSYYFLGYDFASGIEVGSGAILQLDVQFDNTLTNPSIIMTMPGVASGD